jgi:hypothetical protein
MKQLIILDPNSIPVLRTSKTSTFFGACKICAIMESDKEEIQVSEMKFLRHVDLLR